MIQAYLAKIRHEIEERNFASSAELARSLESHTHGLNYEVRSDLALFAILIVSLRVELERMRDQTEQVGTLFEAQLNYLESLLAKADEYYQSLFKLENVC
ncbi:MAG: hypothetical protein OQJ89_10430 [Kangiellaceae bacterium]|nr:hypothetical protein [Kangiellaceae bacterium]MCW9000706.1 hypothetical protein [Kangiellaceae bacterium]MCW9017371.1 hypothetical protein [Kangiellaceae bacterium]